MAIARRYTVELTPAAAKQVRKLDAQTGRRILVAVGALADDPRPHGHLKLADDPEEYRIRVGEYRVVYRIADRLLLVVVVQVNGRDDVYRKRKRRR